MTTSVTLGLAKYDAMRVAITQARQVDEVKDIRDKARALEVYAAQAKDRQAEKQVAEIRVRAERRAGELITVMEKAKGRGLQVPGVKGFQQMSDDATPADGPPTLDELGITRDQSSQWQKVAAIPEDKFEKAVGWALAKESPRRKKRARDA